MSHSHYKSLLKNSTLGCQNLALFIIYINVLFLTGNRIQTGYVPHSKYTFTKCICVGRGHCTVISGAYHLGNFVLHFNLLKHFHSSLLSVVLSSLQSKETDNGVEFRIFVRAFQAYILIIEQWLSGGHLVDPRDEFFIAR